MGIIGNLAESDKAVVGVIGKRINNHSEKHNDVLARLLHGEEGNNIVGQTLPTEALKQYPADNELQSKANQETADEEQQLSLEIVLGLEYPITVPEETVDDTQHITCYIGDAIREAQLGVEKIESSQGDERVERAYHSIFEQLYARLAGFGFIYLHNDSYSTAKLDIINE